MAEFTTDSIFDALKSPLGIIDDAGRRKQIEDYIDAARLPLEQAITDLLARYTEDVDGAVSGHYEVRLNYRPGALSVDVRPREAGETAEETWSMADGEVEKVTLRIPAELKDRVTEAAASAGLSVNSWFVRVLSRAVRGLETPETPPPGGRHGWQRRHHGQVSKRLSGWVGPEE
jgi:predicted HicB family RNase H-like nuclease